jgi:hypothetical protein
MASLASSGGTGRMTESDGKADEDTKDETDAVLLSLAFSVSVASSVIWYVMANLLCLAYLNDTSRHDLDSRLQTLKES